MKPCLPQAGIMSIFISVFELYAHDGVFFNLFFLKKKGLLLCVSNPGLINQAAVHRGNCFSIHVF